MTMRNTFLCLTLLTAACGSPQAADLPQTTQAETNVIAPAELPAASAELLAVARKEIAAEPKVKDFILDPSNTVVLQVAVTNDGSRRYGLAEYFCGRLHDWHLYNDKAAVRIVDASKVEQSGGDFRSISLGTVSCKDASRWD